MITGIYILETKTPTGYEYRIAKATDIDRIYAGFSDSTSRYLPNRKAIKEIFGNASKTDDREIAQEFAEIFAKTDPGLTDGLCFLPEFRQYSFKELTEGV